MGTLRWTLGGGATCGSKICLQDNEIATKSWWQGVFVRYPLRLGVQEESLTRANLSSSCLTGPLHVNGTHSSRARHEPFHATTGVKYSGRYRSGTESKET